MREFERNETERGRKNYREQRNNIRRKGGIHVEKNNENIT
jgi:hypothetical protein